jgi:hypothetical protein
VWDEEVVERAVGSLRRCCEGTLMEAQVDDRDRVCGSDTVDDMIGLRVGNTCYGILYDNQISSVLWSPPNQGLTNTATPVLAPHPKRIMRVVNEG